MLNVGKVINIGIKNLRQLGNGVISGATLEGRPQLLTKIKNAGIKTIVDFRSEATPLIQKECEQAGLKYFKFGLNHTIFENKPFTVAPDFAKKLKQFFEIMNHGDAFIGCQFGIDRTNSGILLNYFVNPQSAKFNVPSIIAGTMERGNDLDIKISKHMPKCLINTINKSIRKTLQCLKRMTPEQRAELGIPENSRERFEKLFKDKIGKLIRRNSDIKETLPY